MATVPPGEDFSSHSAQKSPGKIYRSQFNRMILGVCGGIGDYFNIDATVVRVFWVMTVFIGGAGIPAYFAAAFLIPNAPEIPISNAQKPKSDSARLGVLAGAVLFLSGIIILFNSISWLKLHRMIPPINFWHLQFSVFGPLILITIGALLILMYFKGDLQRLAESHAKSLFRSRTDRKILGVCGGIGSYFHVDSTIVRVFYIFFTLATGIVSGFLIYLICAILLPEEGSY